MYTIVIDSEEPISQQDCVTAILKVDKISVPTPAKEGADAVTRTMVNVVNELLNKNGIKQEEVDYVGLAVVGSIDPDGGISGE